VALKGQRFVAGQRAQGHITYPGYEHLIWNVRIERLEPGRLLSFRWHPYAVDPAVDYSRETPTLVVFELEDADEGALLRIIESGFDTIPPVRRPEAFRMNSEGWDIQMKNLQKYIDAH
jgi:uncharacterized protein YndB with AHSA1/START domain